MIPTCPICRDGSPQDLGPPVYRTPPEVAGVAIDIADLDLCWWRCSKCGYLFLFPQIPADRLRRCYERAQATRWGTAGSMSERRQYAMKKMLLDRYAPGKSVLDFGCFDGGFLDYLGSQYDRFGIEPARDAARIAESRGVKILGATIDDAQPSQPLDAIVSFDVFEHLEDPVGALRALRMRLTPGGIILIETGNSDFPYCKRVGKLHPYMGLVEHVGFFNESSMREAGSQSGLQLVHFQVSDHDTPLPLRRRMLFALYRGAYWVLRAFARMKVPMPAFSRRVAMGPVPRVSGADHFLAVLKRPSESPAVVAHDCPT